MDKPRDEQFKSYTKTAHIYKMAVTALLKRIPRDQFVKMVEEIDDVNENSKKDFISLIDVTVYGLEELGLAVAKDVIEIPKTVLCFNSDFGDVPKEECPSDSETLSIKEVTTNKEGTFYAFEKYNKADKTVWWSSKNFFIIE